MVLIYAALHIGVLGKSERFFFIFETHLYGRLEDVYILAPLSTLKVIMIP